MQIVEGFIFEVGHARQLRTCRFANHDAFVQSEEALDERYNCLVCAYFRGLDLIEPFQGTRDTVIKTEGGWKERGCDLYVVPYHKFARGIRDVPFCDGGVKRGVKQERQHHNSNQNRPKSCLLKENKVSNKCCCGDNAQCFWIDRQHVLTTNTDKEQKNGNSHDGYAHVHDATGSERRKELRQIR